MEGAGASGAGDAERERLQRQLVDDVRTLTFRTQHLSHAFAGQRAMHGTDLEALAHVMHADGGGAPLTAGALADALRLSSAATTSVVDRLERAGHVRRERDDDDRRRVHLRVTDEAMRVGAEFFGPLGRRTGALMEGFTTAELAVVHRFLVGFGDAVAQEEAVHRRAPSQAGAPAGPSA